MGYRAGQRHWIYLETLQGENQRLRDQNRYLQRSVDSYRDGHKSQCVSVSSFFFFLWSMLWGMGRAGLLILHPDMTRFLACFCSVEIAMDILNGFQGP